MLIVFFPRWWCSSPSHSSVQIRQERESFIALLLISLAAPITRVPVAVSVASQKAGAKRLDQMSPESKAETNVIGGHGFMHEPISALINGRYATTEVVHVEGRGDWHFATSSHIATECFGLLRCWQHVIRWCPFRTSLDGFLCRDARCGEQACGSYLARGRSLLSRISRWRTSMCCQFRDVRGKESISIL